MIPRIIRRVQEKLGLTRSEAAVILFLCFGLIVGGSVKLLHLDALTATYDFRESDSFFKEASSKIDSIIAADEDTSGAAGAEEIFVSPVDINTAGVEELVTLPGVGPAIARRIVEYRSIHGKFKSADDLLKVKGIGTGKLEKIRPHLKAE